MVPLTLIAERKNKVGEVTIVKAASMLWRRRDEPGHEFCRLSSDRQAWRLEGTAVFSHGRRPCRLDYRVVCSPTWETQSAKISGWVADNAVNLDIAAGSNHRWLLNGREYSRVAGRLDLDLAFSPSTNMIPIKRLNLEIGAEAEARAAWLRFPEFVLEPLDQRYRRVGPETYRYETSEGFSADLRVNEAGFVTRYAGLWEAETLR
jgi:hypothetical protein